MALQDAATVAAAEAEVDADTPLVFEHYFDVLSSSSSDDDDSNEDLGFSSSGDDEDDAGCFASSASGDSEPEQEQDAAEQKQQVDSSSGSSDDEGDQQQQQPADKRRQHSGHSSDGGGESSSAGDASGDEAGAAAAADARRRTSQRARKPSQKLLQVAQNGEEAETNPAAVGVRTADLASSGRRPSGTGSAKRRNSTSDGKPVLSRREQRDRRRKRRERRRRRERREQRMIEAQQQGLDSMFPKELDKMRRKLMRKRQAWEGAAGGLLEVGGAQPEQVKGGA
jgi:hypothetical protein